MKAQRIYIDGSREIWEITEDDGNVFFQVVTPIGTFVCKSEDEAQFAINDQNLLVKWKGGGSRTTTI